MKLLADASLPGLNDYFQEFFDLQTWQTLEELHHHIIDADILVCRATLKVDEALLAKSSVRYVASATSGIDHLDTNYLSAQGIQWFDAKGANASAVADYVLACIAYLQKEKSLKSNKAGVIGCGEVGSRVQKRLESIGLSVVLYDPPKATRMGKNNMKDMQALFSCDLLTIHANLHNTLPYPSKNLIDSHFLQQLKPNTILINAARGGVINEHDLLTAEKPLTYCTDVYLNEPDINPKIIELATLCTPHIAGHTQEAKWDAVFMLSQQLATTLNLPQPKKVSLPSPPKPSYVYETWQEQVLSLYNPAYETQVLKHKKNKGKTFLALRKAHTFRYAFSKENPLIL